MKFFVVFFLIPLVLVTIVILVAIYYLHKGIRYFRRFSTGEMSGEEFERMANKYYRKQEDDSERFDKDYFKGRAWQRGRQGVNDGDGSRQQRTTRTTHTSGGVTIVDHRAPEEANKKIFARDEGEYVDFTEN